MEKTRTHRNRKGEARMKTLRVIGVVAVLVAVVFFALMSLTDTEKEEQVASTRTPIPVATEGGLEPGVHQIQAGSIVAGTFRVGDNTTRCWAVKFQSSGWIVIDPGHGATMHHKETTLEEVESELRELGWRTYTIAVYNGEITITKTVGY